MYELGIEENNYFGKDLCYISLNSIMTVDYSNNWLWIQWIIKYCWKEMKLSSLIPYFLGEEVEIQKNK